VLQDVGGIRRVPGEQQEVSTHTDCLFKLLVVFRCVPGDTSRSAHQRQYEIRSFIIITLPLEWLKLDVRLVCHEEYSESKYR
jgi:hypothetical protein